MILTADQLLNRIKCLESDRSIWKSHWQELADYILPNKNDIERTRNVGEKVNRNLLDNTALHSNVMLAGFLHGILTNPNSQFFELSTGIEDIDSRDDVRIWLQKTASILLNLLNSSNFQTEVHELYIDMGCFGTSIMSIEEDEDTVVRFSTRPIRNSFIDEDSRGRINQVYRTFEYNIWQVVQEFGEAVLAKSRVLAKAMEKGDKRKFKINHGVYPKEYNMKQSALPWVSQYVLADEKIDLKISGFRSFPYVVPRWSKASGEKYGRSPGMDALPEAKTLNIMVETVIKGAQKVIDPPLQAPDDGFVGTTIRTRPGAINYYRAGSPATDRITPIYNDARIDFGFQAVEEKRQRIRDAFFIDQLKLRQGTPQMTATEVEARVEEALRFMGPVLGRMQSELLRPLIDRVYEIADRLGLIPPAPLILKNMDLNVQYSSPIAKTQRQNEARNILRTIEQARPFIAADPSVLDFIDGDMALLKIANINGFPQEILRDKAQVIRLREGRMQQQQQQAESMQNAATADTIAKVTPALKAVSI
jgi:hypothetical protein